MIIELNTKQTRILRKLLTRAIDQLQEKNKRPCTQKLLGEIRIKLIERN